MEYLNASNIFPLVGGIYYVCFVVYPITAALLEEKIAAQQLYLLRRWDRLDGLAIVNTSEGLFLSWIDHSLRIFQFMVTQ